MINTVYNVYDKVWRMSNNKPTEYTVFSVTIEMGWYRGGATEIFYTIIDESGLEVGHGVRRENRLKVKGEDVFPTKEMLIASL